ncbi:hypothetical protein CRG98_049086, partial [Punica granatum]
FHPSKLGTRESLVDGGQTSNSKTRRQGELRIVVGVQAPGGRGHGGYTVTGGLCCSSAYGERGVPRRRCNGGTSKREEEESHAAGK